MVIQEKRGNMRSKKAIKNIVTSIFQQIITFICGLIVPRAIIGTFGSSVNGLISSITQFLSYITLLEAGIGPVIKSALYKPIAKKDKSEIEKILKASQKFFRVISLIFVIYLIILCFVYPQIVANQFDYMYTVSLIIIISISTFAEYFFGMIYKLYLKAEQKTYVTSIIQSGTTVLNAILVVILIKLNASIQIVKLCSAFVFVLRPIIQNIYVKKKYNINFNNVKEKYNLKQKWDGLSQHIAAIIRNNTDVAILTIFTSTAEVSVYAVYLLVINGIRNIVQAFTDGVDASFGDMIAKGEKQLLNKNFRTYEMFYYTIITIVYIVTMIMILPFVQVYVKGVTDVNYYRPAFAMIFILSELCNSIRLPYNSLTLAAGHFKETRVGAWIESFLNLIISIILVVKFGMVGVVIGTLIAISVRTIEFIYHSSKYILERNCWNAFGRIILLFIEMGLIGLIGMYIVNRYTIDSYLSWITMAIIVTIIVSAIVITTNSIIYRKDVINIVDILKRNFIKRRES